MPRRIAFVVLIAVAFAGCGGTNFSGQVSALSTSLDTASRTYNAAAPTSLAQTGSACAAAEAGLRKESVPPKIPANATYRERAVVRAFKAALRGYSICAKSAPALSYTGMVEAGRAIGTANSWIARAHRGRGKA